jgi:putative membrane protein
MDTGRAGEVEGMSDTRRRFPAKLFGYGQEPDPRFTLANERTFLAWISTSLGFIAAGVALEALGLGLNPSLRTAASLILILAGIATPVQAWIGWYQTERALREARPLPSPFLAAPIGLVVVVVGVLVALAILIP